MIDKVLEIINDEMTNIGVDYSYMINDKEPITYPYVTGEYSENGYSSENKMTTCDLLLECWNRGSEYGLIEVINKIKNHFDNFSTVQDGVGVAIDYSSCVPRRTNDINLKKVEIHLDIVYWKGK